MVGRNYTWNSFQTAKKWHFSPRSSARKNGNLEVQVMVNYPGAHSEAALGQFQRKKLEILTEKYSIPVIYGFILHQLQQNVNIIFFINAR